MKVDFSTVLMNVPAPGKESKALQIMVEPGETTPDGRFIVKQPVTEDMTFAALCLSALKQREPNDPSHRGSDYGPRRSNFDLMLKISQGGAQDITKTERDVLLAKIARITDDEAFGRAEEVLDPQPKEVEKAG